MLQNPKNHSEERKVFKILQLPPDLYLGSSVVGSRQTPQESQIWCSLRQNMSICCTEGCRSGRGIKGIPLYFCKQLLYVFRAKDQMKTALLLSNDIYIVYLNISEPENSQDVNYWFYYNTLAFHNFSKEYFVS